MFSDNPESCKPLKVEMLPSTEDIWDLSALRKLCAPWKLYLYAKRGLDDLQALVVAKIQAKRLDSQEFFNAIIELFIFKVWLYWLLTFTKICEWMGPLHSHTLQHFKLLPKHVQISSSLWTKNIICVLLGEKVSEETTRRSMQTSSTWQPWLRLSEGKSYRSIYKLGFATAMTVGLNTQYDEFDGRDSWGIVLDGTETGWYAVI